MSDLCAPATATALKRSSSSSPSSCLDADDMRRMLRESHLSGDDLMSMEHGSLEEALKKTYSGPCPVALSADSQDTEAVRRQRCWVHQLFSSDPLLARELDQRFRPSWPTTWYTNKYQWLSNHDIEAVMSQYMRAYKRFSFMGALPRDFAEISMDGQCVATQLCRFKPVEGMDYGAIVNHDLHNQSGTHWVSLFFSTRLESPLFGMYYFDSVGQPPKPQVQEFMNAVEREVTRKIAPFPVHYNKVRHQFKNTECGMFSLAFIIRCVTAADDFKDDVSCEAIAASIGMDADVHALRSKYFMPLK